MKTTLKVRITFLFLTIWLTGALSAQQDYNIGLYAGNFDANQAIFEPYQGHYSTYWSEVVGLRLENFSEKRRVHFGVGGYLHDVNSLDKKDFSIQAFLKLELLRISKLGTSFFAESGLNYNSELGFHLPLQFSLRQKIASCFSLNGLARLPWPNFYADRFRSRPDYLGLELGLVFHLQGYPFGKTVPVVKQKTPRFL
jgi:hypothetical protein